MSSLSKLGVGLSVVFASFLLALMAEIYFFCWKKRLSSSTSSTQHIINNRQIEAAGEVGESREMFYFFCWKKHLQEGSIKSSTPVSASPSSQADERRIMNGGLHQDDEEEEGSSPESPDEDFIHRLFPLRREGLMESSELMTIEGLLGPPRFLFTIKEETGEDMESEDSKSTSSGKNRKGSHGRSFSDPFCQSRMDDFAAETPPFLTPPSSPPFYTPLETPPWTPLHQPSPHSKPTDEAGNYTPLMEMCDGSLSSSPRCNSGDENASFITIFVQR